MRHGKTNVRFPPIAVISEPDHKAAMTNLKARKLTRLAPAVARAILVMGVALLASGCSDADVSEGPNGACHWRTTVWDFEDVSPPNRVQVWSVSALGNDQVKLNDERMSLPSAISQIEATKDYDPGAYVLLSRGKSSCAGLKELADEIDARFNCDVNYCFVVPD